MYSKTDVYKLKTNSFFFYLATYIIINIEIYIYTYKNIIFFKIRIYK